MTRDITEAQFRKACRRNGWRITLFWITRDSRPGLSVGMVAKRTKRGLTPAFRATLAKAHRLFKEYDRSNP